MEGASDREGRRGRRGRKRRSTLGGGGGGGGDDDDNARVSTEDPSPSASAFFEPGFLEARRWSRRGRPASLRASADDVIYSRAEAAALLAAALGARRRAHARRRRARLLTRADAIVGCLRFTSWHYLVVVTRKRLEAAFGREGGAREGAPQDILCRRDRARAARRGRRRRRGEQG